MTFLRATFAAEGVLSCDQLRHAKDGRRASVAGVVLVRQRPGKGNAVFITVEDESGVANALMWARDFEEHRRAVMASRLMVLHGVVQRSDEGVVHLMTTRVEDRTHELRRLSEDHQPTITLSRADEFIRPQHPRGRDPRHDDPPRHGHPRDVRVLPKSRDFH